MNSFVELLGEVLLSGCGPKREGTGMRLFVLLTMALAGICFLVFAVFTIVHNGWHGMSLGLVLFALAAASFWLVRRARQS
jgi:hypothetical protein